MFGLIRDSFITDQIFVKQPQAVSSCRYFHDERGGEAAEDSILQDIFYDVIILPLLNFYFGRWEMSAYCQAINSRLTEASTIRSHQDRSTEQEHWVCSKGKV